MTFTHTTVMLTQPRIQTHVQNFNFSCINKQLEEKLPVFQLQDLLLQKLKVVLTVKQHNLLVFEWEKENFVKLFVKITQARSPGD